MRHAGTSKQSIIRLLNAFPFPLPGIGVASYRMKPLSCTFRSMGISVTVFAVTFTCEIADPTRTEPDRQTQSFHLLRPTWVEDAGERAKLKEDAKTRILELQQRQQATQQR